jgi:putative endonuclease
MKDGLLPNVWYSHDVFGGLSLAGQANGRTMQYHVYILRSLSDRRHYVGMTTDIEKRIKYHNSGRVRSTKHRVPFELLYKEVYATRAEARAREKYLKSYAGSKEKLSILESL